MYTVTCTGTHDYNACIYITAEIHLQLHGQVYGNNSIVTLTDIGDSKMSALLCLTSNAHCCNNLGRENGQWYLPDGTNISKHDETFRTSRGLYLTALLRNISTSPSGTMGIFWCTIPDIRDRFQNIYVGVYPDGIGKNNTVLMYDQNFSY